MKALFFVSFAFLFILPTFTAPSSEWKYSKLFRNKNRFFLEKVVCYWQRRINVSLIDPFICTHIIFAFVNTNIAGDVIFENIADEGENLTEK